MTTFLHLLYKWRTNNLLHAQIWPASPPRKNLYAEEACLVNPICSPLAAKILGGVVAQYYLDTGTELLTDEDKHVAMMAAKTGS